MLVKEVVVLDQLETKFIPHKNTNLEFYFAIDFNLDEIVHEINKYMVENFWSANYVELEGDWTRVPVVRHKLKLVRANLFD